MNTESDITRLHTLFGELTDRKEPLRFALTYWRQIFQDEEYKFHAARIEADMRVLVSYLKQMIAEDKRRMGSLKLRNFLQPDQWFADLAEAKAWQATRRRACAARPMEKINGHATDEDYKRAAEAAAAELKRTFGA